MEGIRKSVVIAKWRTYVCLFTFSCTSRLSLVDFVLYSKLRRFEEIRACLLFAPRAKSLLVCHFSSFQSNDSNIFYIYRYITIPIYVLLYYSNTSIHPYIYIYIYIYLSHDTPTIHCFNRSVKSFSPLISIQECHNDISHCSPLKSV